MDFFSWAGDLIDDGWKWVTSKEGTKFVLDTGSEYLKGTKGNKATNDPSKYMRDAMAGGPAGSTRLANPTTSEAAPIAGTTDPIFKGQKWDAGWMITMRQLIGD